MVLCCDWLFFSSSNRCISNLAVHSVICSLGSPPSHGSPVAVFFDRGHLRFWNFYSAIPVDVVRVKSYMNCLYDPAGVIIRVTINKLYFVPEWLVSGVRVMLGHALKRRRSRYGRVECLLFLQKRKRIAIRNQNRWQLLFLLGDDGGFCYKTFGALVKALNNTGLYWLRVVLIMR